MSGPPAAPPRGAGAAGTPSALIRYFLARYRRRLAAGIALLVLTNALALSIPRLLKHAIDAMSDPEPEGRVVWFAAAIAVVALLQAGVRTGSRLALLGMSRLVVFDLRNRVFSHIQRLPLSFFRDRSTGDVVSRAINDVTLVRSFFGPGILNLTNTTMIYIGSVALMASMSPALTLYALAPYPLFAFSIYRMSKRVYSRVLDAQQSLATLTNKAQENISGISLIKTYVREEQEARAFAALGADYCKRNLALSWARGVMIPLMGTMSHVGTIVVIFIGGRQILAGQITLGDFVAFNAYLAFLMWPTFAFGWILNTFQRGLAAMRRIGEILSEEPELREATGDQIHEAKKPFEGHIEFRDLSFAHGGAPDGVRHLEGVSARIRPGEVIGILGTVGAGKSTLVSFLARILDPPPGTVFIDGEDVNLIPLPRLRRHVAMVPQESFLFSRSIRENVAYAPRDFAEEEILEAVERSRLSRDLASMPRGLDTVVGEKGFTLSGGQRKRATVARAIIAAPSILVLDDPLSSVDAAVEEEMLEGFRTVARGRTVVLISNRVAAFSWANRVLVMDGGKIVEQGTHDELMAGGGLYASIARRQTLESRLSEI